MANNAVIGGKVAAKSCRRVGGGRWRWRWRRARCRRGGASDDASDEEYVVGGDGEEEESSDDPCSSSVASLEAADARSEGDEEDEGEYDREEIEAARGRRPRKGAAHPGLRRRAAAPFVVVEVEEETEAPLMRKARVIRRERPLAAADQEGDECDGDDDEDFAPEENEDDEEEPVRAPLRRPRGGRKSPVKRRQRRKARSRNSDLREKWTKAPARKTNNRRKRIATTSDDEDFIVKDRRISVEATDAKKKNKKRRISSGTRRAWASRPDASESDSSDFDYTFSMEQSRDLTARRPLRHLVRRPLSSGAQGEKGKGKDDGDLGKQVCGICLSAERKGIVRGLLDCCTHYFCFACIVEWSKVESRCPLCKRRFKTLRKLASSDLRLCLRTQVIRIPGRDQVYQPSEEEIRAYLDPYANVVCIECQQGVDDNLMLLCDICDSPAHTYCVGLGWEVPEGNWYCDGCRAVGPGLSNAQVQESIIEHRGRSDRLQVNFQSEIDSGNASVRMPHESPQRLATLPCQLSSDEIGEGASSGYPSSLGDHETAMRVPGFTGLTVSGRRSIHRCLRTMISNNMIRWIPERVARDSMIQPSNIEINLFSYGTQQRGEILHVQQERFTSVIDEMSSRTFLGSRVNMHPCTHNEGSS